MSSDTGTRQKERVGLLGWLAGTDMTHRLDERELAIQHEAFAVGYTVLLHLCIALAAVEVWVWGDPVRWASWWTIIVPSLAVLAVVRWSALKGGVSLYSNRCMSRRDRVIRSVPATVLVLVWAVGFLRGSDVDFSFSTGVGMVVGLLFGLAGTVGFVTLVRWLSNRKRAAEQAAWDDDDEF